MNVRMPAPDAPLPARAWAASSSGWNGDAVIGGGLTGCCPADLIVANSLGSPHFQKSEFRKSEQSMDRLDELAVLVAVIDNGSLAAAARRLRRSPPAVTRALAALEERV